MVDIVSFKYEDTKIGRRESLLDVFDMNKSQLEPKLVTTGAVLLPWDLSPRGRSVQLDMML